MKNKTILALLLFVAAFFATPAIAEVHSVLTIAQVTATDEVVLEPIPAVTPPNDQAVKAVEEFVPSFLEGLVVKFPWLASVIVFMGTMRIWAKPLFTGIHWIIGMTSTKKDDGIWNRFIAFLKSPAGAFLHWFLDYFCSIKLVTPKKSEGHLT